jgi:hypothetical protein
MLPRAFAQEFAREHRRGTNAAQLAWFWKTSIQPPWSPATAQVSSSRERLRTWMAQRAATTSTPPLLPPASPWTASPRRSDGVPRHPQSPPARHPRHDAVAVLPERGNAREARLGPIPAEACPFCK